MSMEDSGVITMVLYTVSKPLVGDSISRRQEHETQKRPRIPMLDEKAIEIEVP